MHVGLLVVGGEEEARWMDEGMLGVIQAWGPPGRGTKADRSTCGGGGAEGSVKLINAEAQQKA